MSAYHIWSKSEYLQHKEAHKGSKERGDVLNQRIRKLEEAHPTKGIEEMLHKSRFQQTADQAAELQNVNRRLKKLEKIQPVETSCVGCAGKTKEILSRLEKLESISLARTEKFDILFKSSNYTDDRLNIIEGKQREHEAKIKRTAKRRAEIYSRLDKLEQPTFQGISGRFITIDEDPDITEARAGKPWTLNEEAILQIGFNTFLKEEASNHQRTAWAIKARLIKNGWL